MKIASRLDIPLTAKGKALIEQEHPRQQTRQPLLRFLRILLGQVVICTTAPSPCFNRRRPPGGPPLRSGAACVGGKCIRASLPITALCENTRAEGVIRARSGRAAI